MRARLLATLTILCSGCTAAIFDEPPPQSRGYIQEVRIPPGHLPPPGSCRVWYPDNAPGRQPPAGPCDKLDAMVPSGAWLLYRPSTSTRVVRLR